MPAITARAAAPVLLLLVLVIARSFGPRAGARRDRIGLGRLLLLLPADGRGRTPKRVRLGFITFTISAAIVAWLAARAERRRREALAGRREIERLYQQLQSAFDRASEVEAARRNEQLKAALLDALTHNLRTPLTAIKAAVTALIGTGSRTRLGPGCLSESRRRAAPGDRRGIGPPEPLRRGAVRRGAPRRRASGVAPGRRRRGRHRRGRRARADRHRAGTACASTSPDGLPPVAVDAAAVAEVIYMLLDNASKYAPENTEIRVAASRRDARHVTIEVADEGPGVPPALRERVFEKFYRVPGREPADPQRAGIGLGLSIARRLVEAQGGRMWIQAAHPSGGTAVMMTLPGAPTASPAADAAAVAQSSPAVTSQEPAKPDGCR